MTHREAVHTPSLPPKRPSQGKSEQTGGIRRIMAKQITAQTIVEHMSSLGPTARVALVGRDMAQIQDFMQERRESLLTLYGDRFSGGYRVNRRIHHIGAGQIDVFPLDSTPKSRFHGPQWSMVVVLGEIPSEVEQMLRLGLRLGPKPEYIVSNVDEITTHEVETLPASDDPHGGHDFMPKGTFI
jgi:phage terminase large subunit-like protein